MSKLQIYRETERAIKELQEKLRALDGDTALAQEREFEDKLRALMAEYCVDLTGVVDLLNPSYREKVSAVAEKGGNGRRQLQEMTFKNPYTGEEATARRTNHKVIKGWIAEYGKDVVLSWKKQD